MKEKQGVIFNSLKNSKSIESILYREMTLRLKEKRVEIEVEIVNRIENLPHLWQISLLYFFHICNEIQIQIQNQLSRVINYLTSQPKLIFIVLYL